MRRSLLACDTPANAAWGEWLSEDSAWRKRMLVVANSGFLGLQSRFEEVEQICQHLPEHQLAMLGLTAAMSAGFCEERRVETYSRHCLWRHSVATAHVAETIARVTEACNPLDAFTAGLCHDIGWLEIETTHEIRWHQWLASAKDLALSPEQESSHFPMSHADAGYELLEKLDAPYWVVSAAKFHHRSHLCDLETQPLVGCVAVANYLVSRQGWTSIGTNHCMSPPGTVLRQLGITSLTLRLLWSQLSMLLDEAGTLANAVLCKP